MKTGISIIVPVFNEAENIPAFAAALDQALQVRGDVPVEVLFVNDGSTDNTAALLRDQPFGDYPVRLVSLSRNFGSHAALRAGVQQARMGNVAFLYADLQDAPELVLRLYNKAQDGYDVVWGHRESTGHGFWSGLFSRGYVWLMQRFVYPDFPEKGFDILLFSDKVAAQLNQHIESNSSIFLQVLGMGFSQAHITYARRARAAGKSKWSWSAKLKLLVDSFVAFSYAPIRFLTVMGILMFLVGLGWTIYISTRKLVFDDLLEGWPMLTSIILLGFGLTNIALGIIAEYLWRTLDASRRRPVFIVDDIVELHQP